MRGLKLVLIVVFCGLWGITIPSLSQGLEALVYTTYDNVSTLDPAYVDDSASAAISMMVYESLIRPTWLFFGVGYRPGSGEVWGGDFLPMLATAVPSIENGLVRFRLDGGADFHFPIRQGVRFHNGAELTPEDVEYTYERAMILEPKDNWRLSLLNWALLDSWGIESLAWEIASEKGITEIQDLERLPDDVLREACIRVQDTVEVDGNKVIFHLHKDYKDVAVFLSYLAHGDLPFNHIVNKNWVIKQGGWPGTCDDWVKWHNLPPEESELYDKMNGTGPFKLVKWIPNQEISLVAHDDYWDGKPKLRGFMREEVTCPVTRRVMILGGQADIANLPPSQMVEQPGIGVVRGLPRAVVAPVIFFNTEINTENNPFIGSGMLDGDGIPEQFFADVNVRKAFAYAFDYDRYVARYEEEVLKGLGKLEWTGSPIPRVFEGYYNPEVERYYLDYKKACELLRPGPWGEYSEVWNTGFSFVIPYSKDNQTQKIIAELIKEGIESLNKKFRVEVREISGSDYLNYLLYKKLPIFVAGWHAETRDPHDFVQAFMHSGGPGGGWSWIQFQGRPLVELAEKKYDPLIEKAASTTNVKERQKLYFELQKLAFEDAIQLYLPYETDQRAVSTQTLIVDLPWSPMWAEIFVWNMTVKRR